ncbi:hypothetical protein [Streptomyces sp. TLI_171]|uniref:hypothetical protein n=1 Tax=Streptomyces sp. TLI_171 TaxID=1938859 RepID=UPI000C6B3D0D|nr:hypothetical protein [Streptomyces sp. TLI_171]RKE19465.1 hypothetical protein BX266_2787 [Streptomyces sp. TLI_171]
MSNPYQQPDPYGGNGYGQPQQPGYGYPQQQPPQGYGYPQAPQPYPQQPGYPFAPQVNPAVAQQQKTMATASAAIGVIATLTACWFGWLLGLVGIGLGIASLNKVSQTGQNRGVAIGGIVINALALLIGIAIVVLYVVSANR